MKAIAIKEFGGPEVLELVDRPKPVPQSNEVLIRVKAAGLNGLDILQRKGKYPVPSGVVPDIPGLEVAGIVEECGSEVLDWDKGDEVCALISGGGYAEYAVADRGSCLPMPGNLSFVEAASLPEALFTVWHNVFQRGRLKSGESFLIHGGSSGIGVTAIQLAKAFGATVYATAGSDEKCKRCIELGASLCFNYNTQDFEKHLRKSGVDVILDMVGGDYISKNINILRPEGRLVFINAKSPDLQGNVYAIMQKRLTITGSTLRSRELEFKAELAADVLDYVWPAIIQGKFRPVVYQTFKLGSASEAHRLMESSKHIGKLVLEVQ
jgi:NADPH:quinone reductase